MKIAGIIICFLLTFALTGKSFPQEITQSIRGRVVDKDSQMPLPGASLVIAGSEPQIGTTSGENGEFNFGKLAVGKYDIIVFYVGYEMATVRNVVLISGKETVLTIQLTESVQKLDEVVILANRNKAEAIDKMAAVSVMKFNVEAMQNYAGTINDAARVVSSFAGVAVNPSGANDIIIRGNSPRGMSWRLEGLDIPNPNHYAEEGSSGGGLSILNAAVLANSDFFTGAFPAQYGNAYSGIFDMRLRNGNNQKREYTLQAGFLGVDATLEGPFSKKHTASYLFNYRFSSLMVFKAIGIEIRGDAVPEFQDMTFKFIAPTKKLGTFTLFGIGGTSKVHEEENTFTNDYRTDMGVVGLKHIFFFNKSAYLTSIIAYTGTRNLWDFKKPDQNNNFTTKASDNLVYQTPKVSVIFNQKFNAKNVLRVGAVSSFISYRLLSERFNYEKDQLFTELDHSGFTTLLETFADWKHRFNKDVSLIAGMHSMYLFLTGNYSIEPRLGLKWKFAPAQTFSLGIGLHSKMESLSTYYAQQVMPDSTVFLPNQNLGFIKAGHFVIGYENMLNENLLLKVELYYQQLFNVPVENSDTSSFSVLNYNFGYTNRSLVNTGTGRNFGLEVTLEKYFSRNYYYLLTLSLFESKYKAGDGLLRNTRYNSNHILNLMGGKDFHIGKGRKKRILGINLKGTWAGGQWSTPIDIERSKELGFTVRDEKNAFTKRWPDFFRFDFKVYLSRDRKKTTHTFELDIQNVTNQLNVIGDYYDADSGQLRTITQLGIVPIFNYRLEF
ncbi:MAG: TonB-dependent receptor [Bacteroidales bacterium]|nr:TonB-dependent receptor [Bacteroidales bacterium]